jgi:hypothetical protein
MFDSREYLILSVTEINLIDFSQVLQTDQNSLRRSVDQSKVVIKWDGDQPSFVNSLTTKEGPYTHQQILPIMSSPEWVYPDPLIN